MYVCVFRLDRGLSSGGGGDGAGSSSALAGKLSRVLHCMRTFVADVDIIFSSCGFFLLLFFLA